MLFVLYICFYLFFILVVPLQACMRSGAQLSRAALDNGTDAQVSYLLLAVCKQLS